ncbi:DIS3-like exonuclease 1 isoform X2 [Parasteatoda tepidariorum]|uniref:DIS3-like exonuclease 1 isoform X2 n=1 Tax=Parasteatoda tepidariorum TaxID=114398 RepID=UPI0039BC3BEC
MGRQKHSKPSGLQKDVTHYALPCIDIILNYLEILELPELQGFIILQSIAAKVMQSMGQRFSKRLLNITKDIRHGSTVFLNEISIHTHVPRSFSESYDEWLIKCCVRVAEFYSDHLERSIPIILITHNIEAYKSLVQNPNVKVYTLGEYLNSLHKNLESALQLYESLNLAISAGTVKDLSRSYDNYLPSSVLEAGIKAGRYFKGYLRVNKHNASEEAFVASSKAFKKDSGDIFIHGMIDRNRAIHGDEVVVEILPESQWKSRSFKLKDNSESKDASLESNDSTVLTTLTTGKIVGILERRWRNYVATLPEEDDSSSASKNKERILVIPYDYRIPKIRIVTKQAEGIRNQRILVRIDSWEKESQYPNGHLVQVLGEIGDIETEVQSLLIEHELLVKEFPQNLVAELPICTDEQPWLVEDTEIAKRKDLRFSHLIFSIDPKGCEDVDDTLSVRELPNGFLELGVHIADVTHFVKPLSLVDLEARSRSTSVYLPDRRYDMLPHVLSGNLCSLLGSVDRYAVSVLWELDKNYQVQNAWYGRTIIRSSYKLCYEAAQDILFGATAEKMIADIPELQGLSDSKLSLKFQDLKNALSKLYSIANSIRRERLQKGGLELNSINMKFEIDRNLPSAVADVKSAKELAVHKTVAECMIFANHWVAKKISEVFPHQAVLRHHPNPREADLAELQKLASNKGFILNVHSNKELALSLEQAVDSKDPAVNQILRILATHTMNQATYCCAGSFSEADFYHYGLGLDKYTHFTSPIRRYADVLVHRLLLAAVEASNENTKFEATEMEELCNHMNIKHKAAQDIEKDAQQLFLALFFDDLTSKGNDSPILVDAVIYSLRTNGVLVFIPKYGVKGALQLCNKEKKVAIVTEKVDWVDGKISQNDSSLIVEALGLHQQYHIFDHLTVSIKVQRSRSHQHKILFDLIKKEPYLSDWETTILEEPSLPIHTALEVEKKNEDCNSELKEEISMYKFLEHIRALTLLSKD